MDSLDVPVEIALHTEANEEEQARILRLSEELAAFEKGGKEQISPFWMLTLMSNSTRICRRMVV